METRERPESTPTGTERPKRSRFDEWLEEEFGEQGRTTKKLIRGKQKGTFYLDHRQRGLSRRELRRAAERESRQTARRQEKIERQRREAKRYHPDE